MSGLLQEQLQSCFNLLAVKCLLRTGHYQAIIAFQILMESSSPNGYVVNGEGELIDLYMDMDKLTGFSEEECDRLLDLLLKFGLVQEIDSGVFYISIVAG